MQLIKTKFTPTLLIISLVVFIASGFFPRTIDAASLLLAEDTMSTQALNTAADHTFTWTLPGTDKNTTAGKITIDFVDGDFTTSGSWQTTDFTFSDNLRTNQAPIAVGTGAASCGGGGANAYTVDVTAATDTYLITFCTGWSQSSTGLNTFKILGATGGTGVLTNKASNVESSLVTITDSVVDNDSTTLAVVVETNGVVTVTATVNPTLTLAISTASVSLGVLTSGSTGTGSNTAQVATNATGGFLLTYNGPTLTASGGTIAAYGSQQSSVAGTAGFGINMVSNTTPPIGANRTQTAGTCANPATDYGTANKFSYVASTTTSLTNQAAPADCTFTVSYVANVSNVTPAGSYSAAITYVASGTF